MFYQFVDFKAKVFSYIDRVVFWKLAHWLARKYRTEPPRVSWRVFYL
ncbi:group II intron, maturase-specific domain protein [Escherichia coli 1-110-08_S3_C1]|nr:group II intron, maturase-specific domain protein [Escherichia coli 1-110-08_S3_C1]EYE14670.1 group II intron, maturase-specific domain protein [Escherichia coli 1-110-08_S3_C2]